MSKGTVTVPCLWNNSGSFLNNQLITVEADSYIIGVKSKPSLPFRPGHPEEVPAVNTVQIFSKALGTLFVNLTLDEYNELLAEAITPDSVGSTTITADATGDTITNDAINPAITAVIINDTTKNTEFTISGHVLTFSGGTTVNEGDIITLIYK